MRYLLKEVNHTTSLLGILNDSRQKQSALDDHAPHAKPPLASDFTDQASVLHPG